MAEFDAAVRTATRADIRQIAAELLERLYPGQGSHAKGRAVKAESRKIGGADVPTEKEAEEYTPSRRREHSAAERERAARELDIMEGKMPMPMAERSEDAEITWRERYEPMEASARHLRDRDIGAGDTESYAPRVFRSRAGAEETAAGARELSEFFRRDSRRYDKEFERY